jgi:UDP-N-acetylglucosamine--N-acetylmuramyl-(pentapeptide) pyrophosphoryl-undecaprenol N-acetylglucosamine transferase
MERKFIISGGGTGGHIFPALSIANGIRKRDPDAKILFVGALGRMEMERVPAAGYPIVGLPVEGLQRKISFRNLLVMYKLMISLTRARRILNSFKPNVVIGVGGYASGPLLRVANRKKIPTVIQEQNSYAGITNRLLANKAARICVAYQGMDQYFPAAKIVVTGNPVREEIINSHVKRPDACKFFNLSEDKPVLLVIGGSQGARTINNSILDGIRLLEEANIQVLWQTGKYYYKNMMESLQSMGLSNIRCLDFINRMDMAYHLADVIISRAGAGTISELCLAGKPVILVPSPNVAEDHQTKNAMALVQQNAALMVSDKEAPGKLVSTILQLIQNDQLKVSLGEKCKKMGIPDSAERIVDEIFNLAAYRDRSE